MRDDALDDEAVRQAIIEYAKMREEEDQKDPSLNAPWGILRYAHEYKSGKCNREN